VNGDLTLNSGTLDVSASNYGINIANDLVYNGWVFTSWSGTVTQTLDTTGLAFYNLAVNSGAVLQDINPDGLSVDNTLT
jgi:hypothetical protein